MAKRGIQVSEPLIVVALNLQGLPFSKGLCDLEPYQLAAPAPKDV